MPGHKKKRLGLAQPGNGSWKQFEPGNEVNLRHGTRSRTDRYVTPVAEAIETDLLGDPQCPDLLRQSIMLPSVRAWARAEAESMLAHNWLQTLDVTQRYEARKQGQSAPIEIWAKLDKHAANLRTQNGLTPVSAARIHKSMTSAGLDLAQLAAEFGADMAGADLADVD